jgi:hypothetical protein
MVHMLYGMAQPVTSPTAHPEMIVLAGLGPLILTDAELELVSNYFQAGGKLLLLMGYDNNLSAFLEPYGIDVSSDNVIRSQFDDTLHSQVAVISDGVKNRVFSKGSGRFLTPLDPDCIHAASLTFLYPFGHTLVVTKPAVETLSMGS